MPPPPCCCLCSGTFSSKSPGVSCSASCKKSFHLTCINLPTDLSSLLKSNTGLIWRCTDCINNPLHVNRTELLELLDKKLSDVVNSLHEQLKDSFEKFKLTFIETAVEKLTKSVVHASSEPTPVTYASKLATPSQATVIIKPKNQPQNKSITKSDILKKLDPVSSNIQIKNVKPVNNGGIVLNLRGQNDADRFKSLAQQSLSSNYDVKVVKSILPRVRIVGFSQDLDDFTLCRYLLKQNPDIINDDATCKLLKHGSTKKNQDVYQAVFQVDSLTYKKMMDAGRVLIGLDSCTIFDAIDILRCFKCNCYHHSSKDCKNGVKCPMCAGEHAVKDCSSKELCCSNCVAFKNKSKSPTNIDVQHAAWDHNKCHVYKQLLSKLKRDVFPPPQ